MTWGGHVDGAHEHDVDIYIYKVSFAHDINIYIFFLMFVCGPRTLSCPLGPTSPGLGLQSMHAALFAGW